MQAVSGSQDGFVMVWNFAGGRKDRQAFRYIGHTAAVTSVTFDPSHNLIASSSKDKSVRLWKPTAEGRSTVLKAHTAAVRACAFSANGQMLATCGDDKMVKVGQKGRPVPSGYRGNGVGQRVGTLAAQRCPASPRLALCPLHAIAAICASKHLLTCTWFSVSLP